MGAWRAQARAFSRVGACIRRPACRSCWARPGRPAATIAAAELEVLGDSERDLGIEDVVEALRVAWHERLKMFMHLLLDCDFLADQVAPAPGEQLETNEDRLGLGLEQAEAVDGGAVDGGEIGVIGLVAGVGGLSELFGGERVDDADLGAGLGEGRWMVRGSGLCARRRRRGP